MIPRKNFLIAGGDGRFLRLADLLARQYDVGAAGFQQAGSPAGNAERLETLSSQKDMPDVLILPAPVSRDGESLFAPLGNEKILLRHLLDLCRKDTLILGGTPPETFLQDCAERGFCFTDYGKREDFAVLNAVPTAEGALQLAMEQLPVTISGLPVLIAGYGKIGRICHKVFAGAGADITVSARSCRDLAWAEAYGGKTVRLSELQPALSTFRLILSTIPAPVFGEKELKLLQKDVLLLDLASAPGGTDWEAAEKLKIHALPALSLPGKAAPDSAALILLKIIRTILAEKEGIL